VAKDVWSALVSYESASLCIVEPLHCACVLSHLRIRGRVWHHLCAFPELLRPASNNAGRALPPGREREALRKFLEGVQEADDVPAYIERAGRRAPKSPAGRSGRWSGPTSRPLPSVPVPSRSASAAAAWRSASAPSSSSPRQCTPSPGCSERRATPSPAFEPEPPPFDPPDGGRGPGPVPRRTRTDGSRTRRYAVPVERSLRGLRYSSARRLTTFDRQRRQTVERGSADSAERYDRGSVGASRTARAIQ